MDLSQFTVKGLLIQQLRDEIILGNFEPGRRLILRDLADQFKVSTQPIRQALTELEAEGLVQTTPRKGHIVTVLSADELLDIYEIRATLEAMATRLAVPHITTDHLTTLESIIDDMDNHMGEVIELVHLNKQFHLTLYEASGRQHLLSLVGSLRNHTAHYLHAYMIDLGGMPLAQDEHRTILEACQEQDVGKAATIMHDHVMAAGNGIIAYVNRQSETQNQDSN